MGGRPGIYETYATLVRVHLKPAVGSIRLQDLKPEDLQRLYNQKAKAGLAASTIRHIHLIIHAALQQAAKNGLVYRNVSELTTLPKGPKKEVRALTPEEQELFLRALEGERLRAAFLVLLFAGLRRGELLALTWEDIDLSNGTLQVRRNLVRTKEHGLTFTEPKTKTSRRVVPLPASLVAELRVHKTQQAKEKLQAGEAWQDHGLVFTTEFGTPIEPRNFNRAFYRIRNKAGLPEEVNLHALRHTYATRLIERGVPMKTAQVFLGHANYQVTADTYSHVTQETETQAVQVLNDLIPRQAAKKKIPPRY